MFRTFVPLAAVVVTACASPSLSQSAGNGCRFSPNPRAVQMDCLERQAPQSAAADSALCPGTMNPKQQGSTFCARSDAQ